MVGALRSRGFLADLLTWRSVVAQLSFKPQHKLISCGPCRSSLHPRTILRVTFFFLIWQEVAPLLAPGMQCDYLGSVRAPLCWMNADDATNLLTDLILTNSEFKIKKLNHL